MLSKLFFCALFLSLSGCAATQVDYIKVEKLDPTSTDKIIIDGIEFKLEDISDNENVWVYLPNITVYKSELENRYRKIEFFAFIDKRGYVRHIKVYKSTGLENLDRKIVHLLTNKARTKIWLKDGKPVWKVARQKMEFFPE